MFLSWLWLFRALIDLSFFLVQQVLIILMGRVNRNHKTTLMNEAIFNWWLQNYLDFINKMEILKSIHFKKTVGQSSFLSKVMSFSLCFEFSKNDNTFERNEDCTNVFLKWTDFRRNIGILKTGHEILQPWCQVNKNLTKKSTV